MFTALVQTIVKRTVSIFVFLALSVLLGLNIQAQIGSSGIDEDPSSGMRHGHNTIVGQVIYPSGRQVEKRFTVRLSSVSVGEFSTMTDENGVFTFRRLKDGKYFITVEAGKDYLPAQETVDLFDNRERTTTVQIQLRSAPTNTAKPATISAVLVGVPKAAIELYQKGMAAAGAGDNKTAIDQFKAAVALYPSFILALNEMSAAYMALGDLEKAEEPLATALKYEPNNPTLRLNYGYVFLQREKFVDSERELRRAVQLKGNSATGHSYLGLALIRLGRFDEAETELNRAISLGGNSSITAHRYLAGLYEQKKENAKAISELETYLRLAPSARDAERVRAKLKELQDQSSTKND